MIGERAMTYSPVPFLSLELGFMKDVPYKVREEEEKEGGGAKLSHCHSWHRVA
jgi:hypothetical protein